ncbi:uncharacterized mitochondrial protein AtMg00820-like [Lactuca sativa]|uniref:uncharacterized mitochondrial protein AtMg00820-like n=1 Tax=Lactuca sativa TaxID=4236 RepID=UPI0022AF1CF8|nr:uncharacterized mitochondrial protein AtMg00820-like [Lactuca sativa]
MAPIPSTAPTPSHPMVTRAKVGIFKPKNRVDLAHTTQHDLYTVLFAHHDPTIFASATSYSHWQNAMDAEMTALHLNNTWMLMPRPVDRNVFGYKWVFRTQYHADGSIDRYKARLVAQGFSQLPVNGKQH